MGVLGDQPNRNYYKDGDIDAYLEWFAKLATKHATTLETVVKAHNALQFERQLDIRVQAGDYLDEQLGGFGDLMETFNARFGEFNRSIDEIACAFLRTAESLQHIADAIERTANTE